MLISESVDRDQVVVDFVDFHRHTFGSHIVVRTSFLAREFVVVSSSPETYRIRPCRIPPGTQKRRDESRPPLFAEESTGMNVHRLIVIGNNRHTQ